MRNPIPFGHMTCTRCFQDAGDPGDMMDGMRVDDVIALCQNWKCTSCLDELDRIAQLEWRAQRNAANLSDAGSDAEGRG